MGDQSAREPEGPPSAVLIQTRMCPAALARADWRFAEFTVHRMLGEGAMSTVAHCTCQLTGLPVAIKMYHKDRLNRMNVKQVAREIDIHASLEHPHIVKLYAAFEDADGIYLVQEFAAKGDMYAALSQAGGYMSEAQVAGAVLRPLLSALEYMHSLGVLHRDIKPENLLVGADGRLLVGDFGLAINTSRERPVSRVGTLDYMAPEIVRLSSAGLRPATAPGAADPPPVAAYGLPVDVWCVGVLAYELLVGGPPFEAPSKEATYLRILKAEPWLPAHLSRPAHDLVLMALRKEAAQRPGVRALQGHAWLRQHEGEAPALVPGRVQAGCAQGGQQDGKVVITLAATGAALGAPPEVLIRAAHGPGHGGACAALPALAGGAAKAAGGAAARAAPDKAAAGGGRRSRASSLLRVLHLGSFSRKLSLGQGAGSGEAPSGRTSSRLAAGAASRTVHASAAAAVGPQSDFEI